MRTTRYILVYLKQLFKFAHKAGYLKSNVLDLISLPKVPKTLPKFLSRKKVPKFLAALNEYNRAPAILAIFCGLRKNEILNLTWDMVDFKKEEIILPGSICKNSRPRVIPMALNVKEMLNIMYLHRNVNVPNVILDITGTKKRYDIRQGIENAFKAINRTDLTFHCLRKTFATLYISENPEDLYSLMEICGWSSLETAKIYMGDTEKARMDRIKKVNKLTIKSDGSHLKLVNDRVS